MFWVLRKCTHKVILILFILIGHTLLCYISYGSHLMGRSGSVLGYDYHVLLYKHRRSYALLAVSLECYKHFGQSYWLGLALFLLFLFRIISCLSCYYLLIQFWILRESITLDSWEDFKSVGFYSFKCIFVFLFVSELSFETLVCNDIWFTLIHNYFNLHKWG